MQWNYITFLILNVLDFDDWVVESSYFRYFKCVKVPSLLMIFIPESYTQKLRFEHWAGFWTCKNTQLLCLRALRNFWNTLCSKLKLLTITITRKAIRYEQPFSQWNCVTWNISWIHDKDSPIYIIVQHFHAPHRSKVIDNLGWNGNIRKSFMILLLQ